tara:strand:- start:101 stop:892 length:792 start_codon:yes stop_codon:yes gene_type:complete
MDQPHPLEKYVLHERDPDHAFIYMMDDVGLNYVILKENHDNCDDYLALINHWFRDNHRQWAVPPKYGDVIQVQSHFKGNTGLFFVGMDEKFEFVIELPSYELNKFGHVPSHFDVPGFSVRYYEHVIKNNSIAWIGGNNFNVDGDAEKHSHEDSITNNVLWGTPPIFIDDSPPTKQPMAFSWFKCAISQRRIWIIYSTDKKYYDNLVNLHETTEALKSRGANKKPLHYHFKDPINNYHLFISHTSGNLDSSSGDPVYEVLFYMA